MRISDWSSDVCSSDLISSVSHSSVILDSFLERADQLGEKQGEGEKQEGQRPEIRHQEGAGVELEQLAIADDRSQELAEDRSEERRVGKEGVRTCRSRCEPDHSQKKTTTTTKDT